MPSRIMCIMGIVVVFVGGSSQSSGAAFEPLKAPKIFVENPSRQLDPIHEGDKIDIIYTVENRGDAELIINDVRTSCGCATVKLKTAEKIVAPGGSQDILVTFNSKDRLGKQDKSVTLFCNDPDQKRLKLAFSVEVETYFTISPKQKYDFRSVRQGQVLPKPIDVLPAKAGTVVEVVSVVFPLGALFSYRTDPLQGKEAVGQRLTLTVDESAPLGEIRGRVEVTARVGEFSETKSLIIQGSVSGELSVVPPRVRLDTPSVRGNQLRPVKLTAILGNRIRILGVDAGPNIDVTVESNEKLTSHTIRLKIAENATDGPHGAELAIWTSSIVQPLIRVPIFMHVAPRLSIEPPMVLLRASDTSSGATRRLILQNTSKKAFAILGLSADRDFLSVEEADHPALPTGTRFIEVTAQAGFDASGEDATVTVQTDVPGAETLRIPVMFESVAHQAGF